MPKNKQNQYKIIFQVYAQCCSLDLKNYIKNFNADNDDSARQIIKNLLAELNPPIGQKGVIYTLFSFQRIEKKFWGKIKTVTLLLDIE